jgi:hypothetical protein
MRGVGILGVPAVHPSCESGRAAGVCHKLVAQQPKTYVLIFETGDELASGLKKFAAEKKLASSSFKAIGALSAVKLAWFNWETKKYIPVVKLNDSLDFKIFRRQILDFWYLLVKRLPRIQ